MIDDTDPREGRPTRQTPEGTDELVEMRVQLQAAEQAMSRLNDLITRVGPRLQAPVPPDVPKTEPQSAPGQERLIPVVDWPKYHPWPKVSSLRHLIFNASHNGFESVIRRIGSRVVIRERAFFEWIEQQNGKPIQPELPSPSARSQARKANKAKSK